MDTELLKTFLEVERTRHFGRAAEHLFLTQAAVSARIKQLEEILGAQLFSRVRNNVQLTPQGERLLRHAETILNAWTRARHEVASANRTELMLAVGGVPSLWDIFLQAWLIEVQTRYPDASILAEALPADTLLRRIRDRTLDLAVSFESPQMTDLKVCELATIRLVLVTTHGQLDCERAMSYGDYVLVDWGTGFASAHAQAFPTARTPRFRFGLGRLALGFILARGGSAYLPEAMVAVDPTRLTRVVDAPVIERAAFAYFSRDANADGRIDGVLDLLHYQSQHPDAAMLEAISSGQPGVAPSGLEL